MKLIKTTVSHIYKLAISLVLFLYDKNLLKVNKIKTPLISVGNITVGGTGKSPMIIYISKLLKSMDVSHGIISRGYGRKSKKMALVSNGHKICSDIKNAGDEALVIAEKTDNIPLIVGDKAGCCNLIEKKFKPEVILMDDGFQTFRLHKDINMLLVDLSSEIDQYELLPLGRLREPLSGVKRADCVIFTKTNFLSPSAKKIEEKILDLTQNKKIFRATFELKVLKYQIKGGGFNSVSFDDISGNNIAFSGIGNSTSFNQFVSENIKNIKNIFEFKDHCKYESGEIKKMENSVSNPSDYNIITTLKDFVKVKNKISCWENIYIVDAEHKINNEDDFIFFLKEELNK